LGSPPVRNSKGIRREGRMTADAAFSE
jgi:hypothetical protein